MRVRIVSYNIHRAIGTDRRFRPDRVAGILSSHRADILLLQEVDFGVPRSRRMDMSMRLADELGYRYRAAGYNVRLREGMYGNATLTNWPIVRDRNIDLSVGRKKKRGCQYTRLEIPNGVSGPATLDVFNLHLGLSARERRQQLGLLMSSREFFTLEPGGACVVGGDFNDWRSQLEPPLTRALGFECATSHNGGKRPPKRLKTYPAFSPRGPLDRVYFRGGLELVNVYRCRHQASKLASDHLPIIVDLELPDQSRGAGSEKNGLDHATPPSS